MTLKEIQAILTKFKEVFEYPHGLPPIRKHELKIYIREGVSTINV